MTRRDLATLLFLGAMFGASFLYVRVAAPVVGPWVVTFGRVGIAAALLLLVARRAGLRRVAADWRPLFALGVVNTALPFGMFAFAETTITASLAAILNALTPMMMAVAAAAWLGQPLTGRKLAGIGLGLSGVAIVVGLGPLTLDGPTLIAIGACLVATIGYAVGFSFARRRLPHVDPLTISLGQALGATVVLAPGAILTMPATVPGLDVVAAIVALATFSTALAWPLLFRLVATIGPTASSTVTFLAPAFGIGWGALVLSEPVGPSLALGTAVILVSVALVVGLRPPAAVRDVVDTLWTSRPRRLRISESRG